MVAKAAGSASAFKDVPPQELRKAGDKALQQRDFQTAAEIFKRMVEVDPKSAEGWDSLGRAYAGLSNHADAIGAYRKQVEANPFNKRAYNDLGAELQFRALDGVVGAVHQEGRVAKAAQFRTRRSDHSRVRRESQPPYGRRRASNRSSRSAVGSTL